MSNERPERRICKDCRHYTKGEERISRGVKLNDYYCGNEDSNVCGCWVVWDDHCEDWEPRDGHGYPDPEEE